MNNPNWIEQFLKEKGFRSSIPRQRIIGWLITHKGIFSAQDILLALPKLDKVSVYRTLDLLSEFDIIHPILSRNGQQHYELHGEEHHHHAVCDSCEKTSCIPCTITDTVVQGFSDLHHNFILTGTCNSCANSI